MSIANRIDSSPGDRAARNLRRVLFANAASSALAGLAVALFAAPLGRLFVPDGGTLLGLGAEAWLVITGLAVLPFAALAAFAAGRGRPRPGPVAAVVALDIAWVAGTALLLVMAGAALSWPAWILAIAVADLVATFAFLQHRFLRRMQAGGIAPRSGAAPRRGPGLGARA